MAHAFGIKLIYTKWESISCQSQGCLLETSVLFFLFFFFFSWSILSLHSRHSLLDSSWERPSQGLLSFPLCRSGSVPTHTGAELTQILHSPWSYVYQRILALKKLMQQTIYYSFRFFFYFFSVSNELKALLWLIGNYANLWSLFLFGIRRKIFN